MWYNIISVSALISKVVWQDAIKATSGWLFYLLSPKTCGISLYMRLFIFVKNIIALRTLDKRIIKFIWNECSDLPIARSNWGYDTGWFRWSSSAQKAIGIVITPHSSKKELFTTLAHEIGHYKDFKKYKAVYESDDSRQKWERSAWKWAIRFADKYGFDMDYKSAVYSLSSYGTSHKTLENRAGISYKEVQKEMMKQSIENVLNKERGELR